MTYIDPTNTGDSATTAYVTGNIAVTEQPDLTHIIVGDTDFIILETTKQSYEIFTIDPETLEMTFYQYLDGEGSEQSRADSLEWFEGVDGNLYGMDSSRWGTNGTSNTSTLKFDVTTGQFSLIEQNLDVLNGGGTTADALEAFQVEDGTIYGYSNSTSNDGGLIKYEFDTATGQWVQIDTFSTFSFDGLQAPMQGYLDSVTAPDGTTYLIAPLNGGNDTTNDGVEIIQLDANGDPVTSYFYSDSQLPGTDLFSEQMGNSYFEPEIDANGNIILATQYWGTEAGGVVVIDPTTGDIVYSLDEKATDPLTGVALASNDFGGNGDITFSADGRYMYITSQNTWGTLETTDGTHTLVFDTQYQLPDGSTTYALVDRGTDSTAGLDANAPTLTTSDIDGSSFDLYYESNAKETEITTLSNGRSVILNVTQPSGPSADFIVTAGDTLLSEAADLDVPCFVKGSMILTAMGKVAVEDISIGDMIPTLDHGLQPVQWIGSSKRKADNNLAPICIRKGALGNERDLYVSPQHRMLISDWRAELLFGEKEVLVPAKALVNDHSILRVECAEVEYFHILFDTHEIIWAEGIPSESFMPGEVSFDALSEATRQEILSLFPELENGFANYGSSAREGLTVKEGRALSYIPTKQASV